MSMAKLLFPVNCRYNFKVEKDGKCYSTTCMMNNDDQLSFRIKQEGCKCFEMPEVQELLKKQ